MGLGSALDKLIIAIIIGSMVVGFYETSKSFGEFTDVLDRMIEQPLSAGIGTGIWYIGMDVWTPGIPVDNPPPILIWATPFIKFISFFYPFSKPYIPHFSLWVCAFSIVIASIVALLVGHFLEWSFFWHGLTVWFVSFFIAWYGFTLLAWHLMFMGGNMAGLTSPTVYQVWRNAVDATSPPLLQTFFLVCIPLSIYLVGRKVGGLFI